MLVRRGCVRLCGRRRRRGCAGAGCGSRARTSGAGTRRSARPRGQQRHAGQPLLAGCAGDVTVCPYLVFAARTPQSRHDPGEFIAGNIFTDLDIAARLDAYRFTERYPMGANPTCESCGIAGQRIGAVDAEACPVTSADRHLLPLMPA